MVVQLLVEGGVPRVSVATHVTRNSIRGRCDIFIFNRGRIRHEFDMSVLLLSVSRRRDATRRALVGK